jgi:hypothetical protein
MTDNFTPKNATSFYCQSCDFKCCKNSDWKRHLTTRKHIATDNILTNAAKSGAEGVNMFMCECGKSYKHRQSLFSHRKQCKVMKNDELTDDTQKSNEVEEIKEFMKYLMQENSEMKGMMMEVIKNGTISNSHNTISTNNSHNKAFNLQFFLNETCKDAMNITDFVESIKLQLSDLENVAEVGYVEGISNIIVKNLKKLDVTQRPVHCTDKKRETMYVKDENTWEKDEENKKMHKVVKKVTDKNARLILKYKELHPDCMTYHSRYSDQYNKIIVESMGGSGDNMFEKEEKIIQQVSKNVTVDKETN